MTKNNIRRSSRIRKPNPKYNQIMESVSATYKKRKKNPNKNSYTTAPINSTGLIPPPIPLLSQVQYHIGKTNIKDKNTNHLRLPIYELTPALEEAIERSKRATSSIEVRKGMCSVTEFFDNECYIKNVMGVVFLAIGENHAIAGDNVSPGTLPLVKPQLKLLEDVEYVIEGNKGAAQRKEIPSHQKTNYTSKPSTQPIRRLPIYKLTSSLRGALREVEQLIELTTAEVSYRLKESNNNHSAPKSGKGIAFISIVSKANPFDHRRNSIDLFPNLVKKQLEEVEGIEFVTRGNRDTIEVKQQRIKSKKNTFNCNESENENENENENEVNSLLSEYGNATTISTKSTDLIQQNRKQNSTYFPDEETTIESLLALSALPSNGQSNGSSNNKDIEHLPFSLPISTSKNVPINGTNKKNDNGNIDLSRCVDGSGNVMPPSIMFSVPLDQNYPESEVNPSLNDTSAFSPFKSQQQQ